MRLLKKVKDLQNLLRFYKSAGKSVGFVPTMGALHNGHLTLIDEAAKQSDIVVCSIFVNPTQFNDKKDLEKYPRTIEKDIALLSGHECDVLFWPDAEEIYPPDSIARSYHLGTIENLLEGKFRSGHFQGVCQVLDRLFSIVTPDIAFFGQKDYQQCMIVEKLAELVPELKNIRINIVPTVRETSGLAMSSRNARLTAGQKETALNIYKTLTFLKQSVKPGSTTSILQVATEMLTNNGFKIDYVSIADAKTLEPVTHWDGYTKIVALIAAFLGDVRLIDNMLLN